MKQTISAKMTMHSIVITLIALSFSLLLVLTVNAAPTVGDYIKIQGPANFSCFGYYPACMNKTIELCNKEVASSTLDKNAFRYDFGGLENLQSVILEQHVNDITTQVEQVNLSDTSCVISVRNNITGKYEDRPTPCTYLATITTANLTTRSLQIDQAGRFAGSIPMPSGTCVKLTILPKITEEMRSKNKIEYNITFLNQLLDPFATAYNLTQDFDNANELNTTAPSIYSASPFSGSLTANWTLNMTYVNTTDLSYTWTCNSTLPIQGANCSGAISQDCANNDIQKEWIMGCGDTCIGATIELDLKRNVTFYGFITQSNAATYEPKYEVYVNSMPFPKFDTACTSTSCNMNFQNFSNNLVANLSPEINTTCGNQTFTFTPKTGRYLAFRVWGVRTAFTNPRIGELIPLIANFTTGSSAASIVYNLSTNMSTIKFAMNRTLYGSGTIGLNISCDGGNTWCSGDSTNDGGSINCCGSQKNDAIVWRLALQGNEQYSRPTVERLDLEALNYSSTTEAQARNAIENGIKDNFANAAILTDQEVYFKYANNTQRTGITDKYFTYNNKRWVFNYLTGTDTTLGMSGVGTAVIAWENQSLTSAQIQQQVRDLINATK